MEWTRGHVLGRGSSATVSAASSTTGDVFAVKSVSISNSESLHREQHFLSILDSPYVVSYKGCDITNEGNNKVMYNLMMEYMPQGTIVEALQGQKCGKRFDEMEISSYIRQVVKGLEYIHSCGIVHCDIKGANLLVSENNVKIADFGCAKWVSESVPFSGTPMFMAPEVARGEEQGFAADIWALGCVLIEIATGGSPWTNVTDPVSILYKIAYSDELPDIPEVFSRNAKDFITKCLIRDPKARWGASELLKHPFLFQTKRPNEEELWTSSPTSVLDQDVWNTTEESPSMGSHLIQQKCSSYSLRQRVQELACNLENPKWKMDFEDQIDWVTIRRSNSYFQQGGDSLGRVDPFPLITTFGIRQLRYDTVHDALHNYSKMSVNIPRDALENFKAILHIYENELPTRVNLSRRGVLLDSHLCPLCNAAMEMDLFFSDGIDWFLLSISSSQVILEGVFYVVGGGFGGSKSVGL
ncbi:mitogen-activated protein kinase kinase kinase 18-like protein [Tanacetum coccineum]